MAFIALNGLEFYGYHGIPDAEQATGHRYSVDVKVEVSSESWNSDDIESTVDYGKLGQLIQQVGTASQFRTIEKLACEAGRRILQEFPLAISVEITIKKLLPPGGQIVRSAEVTLMLRG